MSLDITIKDIQRENLKKLIPEFLKLEPSWTEVGETLWEEQHFRIELPEKFEGLSKYALLNDAIVGYTIGSRKGLTGNLHKIVSSREMRCYGIGTKLWNTFIESCESLKLARIEFKVLIDNYNAINFYKNRGCLFDGLTKGIDNKQRHNVSYVI